MEEENYFGPYAAGQEGGFINPYLTKEDRKKANYAVLQAKRRQELLDASKEISEGQGGRPLEVLLNMTAAMENSLGADSNAYGRLYTRGPMSIDDSAFVDLFEPRGENGRYTQKQKDYNVWLEGLGFNPYAMDSTLRSDDAKAGMAAARMMYGRVKGGLPDPDKPEEVFDYYNDLYNKGGARTYGTKKEDWQRFQQHYNKMY
jgi:hypothetical protein